MYYFSPKIFFAYFFKVNTASHCLIEYYYSLLSYCPHINVIYLSLDVFATCCHYLLILR